MPYLVKTESSKNVENNTGIHPQALISNFKLLITLKHPIINSKSPANPQNTLNLFAVFSPIDPVFGPKHYFLLMLDVMHA